MSQKLRAVITGAGSGLGRALAVEIARRGGRLVLADINEENAHKTAQLIASTGREAHVVRCDVASAEEVDALARRATELLGEVDLLANNAGVAAGGTFEKISLEDWQWIMGINLWGVIHGCRAFLPAMKARGHGYIINVASLAGLVYMPQMAPYNATKAAVVALSETLYGETQGTGVNVSVLCPSFFATNILASSRSSELGERARRGVQRLMERSKVQADDVARAAVDAVLRGQLHVLPMSDARMMWRLKRAVPERFYALMNKTVKLRGRG